MLYDYVCRSSRAVAGLGADLDDLASIGADAALAYPGTCCSSLESLLHSTQLQYYVQYQYYQECNLPGCYAIRAARLPTT